MRQENFTSSGITPSEALYGFVAWLTTRKTPTTFGGSSDCAEASRLLTEWCEANKLESPRDEVFPKNLVCPTEK